MTGKVNLVLEFQFQDGPMCPYIASMATWFHYEFLTVEWDVPYFG